MKEFKSINIVIKGKVQGVWFRVSTLEQAKRLELNGFVKNIKDGSVYVEAEGDSNKIEEFISWCKKGPENAVVEELIFSEQKSKDFTNFIIEK